MAFIKEESGEAFRVKHEDTEQQQTEMAFIKEESEDMQSGEAFGVEYEDTEGQTDLVALTETEEKHHDFTTGEKSFNCSEERKSFQREAVNSRVNLCFICRQCGRRFTDREQLKKHVITHIGQEPFVCHHCGKCCSKKANLRTHMRIHSGEKPFTCEQCGQSFRQKTTLQIHMRVHTTERHFHASSVIKGVKAQFGLEERWDEGRAEVHEQVPHISP